MRSLRRWIDISECTHTTHKVGVLRLGLPITAHEERRRRKLMVNKRELGNLWSETQRKGMTIVPLVMYFNDKGFVKLKIGIAKGKKNHDKRADSAKRDWNVQKQRLLKNG